MFARVTKSIQQGRVNNFTPSFRTNSNVRKLVVLVTDAPPGGFCDSFDPATTTARAHQYAVNANAKGIEINAIQVGRSPAASNADEVETIMRDYSTTACGWYSNVGWGIAGPGKYTDDAILQMLYAPGACSP
jgi:hypothetical protein